MYNLIHITPDSKNGNMFDRYIRNSSWIKPFTLLRDINIQEARKTLGENNKNILLWSFIQSELTDYEDYFDKFKDLLSCKNFVFVISEEHEAFSHERFDYVWNALNVKNLSVELQRKIYVVSYDVNTKNTYKVWQKENNIVSYFNTLYIDTFIHENLNYWMVDNKILHTKHFDNKSIRPYRYVCYNADPKEYRVRLVNDLIKNNLDKFGMISLLREKNPMVLDTEKVVGPDPLTHRYPIKHYADTYFSVVTESYFSDWDANKPESYAHITGISEKTYKAMLLNPFIVLGGCGTLKYLQKLGFKTFPELFDESYDDIFDPKERYNEVLKNIQNVCKMSVDKLDDLYHKVLVPKVRHNQSLWINCDRAKLFDSLTRRFEWN